MWTPRMLRPPKVQQPRTRRACVGELIQIDGCEHHWFEDRASMYTASVSEQLLVLRCMDSLLAKQHSVARVDVCANAARPLCA